MPLRNKRVVFFGDSSLASVSHALDQGLLKFEGWEHEFWGAAGALYRDIGFRDGRIIAKSQAAKEQALMINGHGREELRPDDFDLFVFYGARLRTFVFFAPYLSRMLDAEMTVSEAAMLRAARVFLDTRGSVRMGQKLLKAGAKRIVYATAGFASWGVLDAYEEGAVLSKYPLIEKATPDMRAKIWDIWEQVFAERGLELLRQPDDTVTQGMFTHPDYAVEGAHEDKDPGHKAPTYAAKNLAQLKLD